MTPGDAKGDSATFGDDVREAAELLMAFTRLGSTGHEVGLGSVGLQSADSSMTWRCRIAWIESFDRKGWLEEDRFRVREGMECTGQVPPDSSVQWRMRRGISVAPREVARLADRLGIARPRGDDLQRLPVHFVRVIGGAAADTVSYRMQYLRREGPRLSGHLLVWSITRQDGTLIATYRQGESKPSTLEFAPATDGAERAAVRSVVALLRVPLRATD